MTPYERLVIALRHGVLVRGKAMQRYHSEVQTLTTRAADDDRFTVVPIEAADAISAARRIAEIAARRRFEDEGSVGYLSRDSASASVGGYLHEWFRATIGVQHPSNDGIVLKGVSILIHVWPTD
jgi:hypothetical protein